MDKKETLLKVLELIKTILIAVIAYFSVSACGTTRAVVTNRAEQTTTTIKITTNNPTSVNASPDVDVDVLNKPINDN